NTSPNFWALLKWLVFAVFPPLATLIPQLQPLAGRNPWLTGTVIVLYEVAVFLLSFGAKIWQKVEDRWVGELAEWVNQRKEWLVSHTYDNYFQHIAYQHRDIDVKGLATQGIYALALSRVFVELSIVPTPAHQTSANP